VWWGRTHRGVAAGYLGGVGLAVCVAGDVRAEPAEI